MLRLDESLLKDGITIRCRSSEEWGDLKNILLNQFSFIFERRQRGFYPEFESMLISSAGKSLEVASVVISPNKEIFFVDKYAKLQYKMVLFKDILESKKPSPSFKHGDHVTCTIEGQYITDAKIVESYIGPSICQNIVMGNNNSDLHGYRYSYQVGRLKV